MHATNGHIGDGSARFRTGSAERARAPADDAVQIHRMGSAARSVGVHFGTFAEHPEQAIDAHEKDLAAALQRQDVPPSTFWVLAFGEGRDVPPLPDASTVSGPSGASP